jgi:hypothetical protein
MQQIAIHSDNGPDEPNTNIVASSELHGFSSNQEEETGQVP